MILGNAELYKSYKTSSSTPSMSSMVLENDSLFIDSLDMIRESNRNLNSAMKRAYKDIMITESETDKQALYIQEMSFGDLITKVIKFFIETLTQIFNKFKITLIKVFDSQSYLLKQEKKFKNMTGSFNVEYDRYIYTVSDVTIPFIDLNIEFYKELEDLDKKLNSLSNIKTKQERINKMIRIESEVGHNEAYLDGLRKRVLKTNYLISRDYYPRELFNAFRNGGAMTSSKITEDEVSVTFDRLKNNKKMITETEKAKNRAIKSAEEVKRKINSITLASKNKYYIPYTQEEEYIFNKILNKEVQQINEACSIFSMAFSAKLDALRESVKQDKRVLYDALMYIETN